MSDVSNISEYDNLLNISINSLDTILLLHIITKYEIDKPTIDWRVVQDHLIQEFGRLKDLNIFSSNDNIIDSLKSEDDTKTFYNSIQDIFSKNHINLEIFLKSKRIELIKSKIEQLNKELKDKEDNIQLIKSNHLEQLKKDQQQNQSEDNDQQQDGSDLVQVKEEEDDDDEEEEDKDQQQKDKTNTTTNTINTTTTTPKSKRKHSALSTPQQTKDELDDEQLQQLQKKKEDEQQKANNIKKILSTSLNKVWKSINSNRYAYIFRYPISKEDAPDYDSVIKHRMDLTTLKKKLDDNLYNNCTEFNKDLILIFKNAMTYNEEDSDIYNAAVSMKKSAEKEMEACFATEELLNSGAGNSLGTRSNRGPTSSSSSSSSLPTTTNNSSTNLLSSSLNSISSTNTTTTGNSGNNSSPPTPSLSTSTVTTMPSPSIRGRNKTNTSTNTPTTTTATITYPTTPTTTRSSSKKNNNNNESDQSNPNTPSLQEESIDFSDDNNPTTPRSNKLFTNTPTSTSRSRSSAKKQAQAQAEAEAESLNSKKISKRQRNSKIDETITHQDD